MEWASHIEKLEGVTELARETYGLAYTKLWNLEESERRLSARTGVASRPNLGSGHTHQPLVPIHGEGGFVETAQLELGTAKAEFRKAERQELLAYADLPSRNDRFRLRDREGILQGIAPAVVAEILGFEDTQMNAEDELAKLAKLAKERAEGGVCCLKSQEICKA